MCGDLLLPSLCKGSFLPSVRPEDLPTSSLNTFISSLACSLLSVFTCHFVMMLQSRLMFCETNLFYEGPRLRYAICSVCYQLSISFEVPVSSPFFPFTLFQVSLVLFRFCFWIPFKTQNFMILYFILTSVCIFIIIIITTILVLNPIYARWALCHWATSPCLYHPYS